MTDFTHPVDQNVAEIRRGYTGVMCMEVKLPFY